jgi:hypothetical protein
MHNTKKKWNQRKKILNTKQTTNQYELDIKEQLRCLTYKDVVFLGVITFIVYKAKEIEKSVNNQKKP